MVLGLQIQNLALFLSLCESFHPTRFLQRCGGFIPMVFSPIGSLRFRFRYETVRFLSRNIYELDFSNSKKRCQTRTWDPGKTGLDCTEHWIKNRLCPYLIPSISDEEESQRWPLDFPEWIIDGVLPRSFSGAITGYNNRLSKFVFKRCLFAVPHSTLDRIGPRLWFLDLVDDCVGQFLNPGMFRLRFRNEELMIWFLLRASWPLSEWMLIIYWWFPNIIEEASMIITLWTRIHGTLILYLTNDMVKFAGFEIGLIIAVDFEATVHSTGFVSVQMLWTCDKEELLKQKSNDLLALMEFTLFGRLENEIATWKWILLVIRGLGLWDDMVDLFAVTFKRITQVQFFKETVVRKCWCHYVYIPELAWDTSALMLRFVKGGHSQKLLSTIRNKEKSNMKLDNNRFFDRLASKATLRKASSNSLLLYFLLVYGTYICVCNNCISLILYTSVITLLI